MRKKPLNQRQEEILLLLKRCDFLTRDQIRRKCNLGTIRNCNRVLYELSDCLHTVREGYQTIYYLNKIGREIVGCEKIRKKGGHIIHTVMRNEFWLYSGCPSEWKNEIKVSDGEKYIVVDSMFNNGFQHHFLEVDHMQPMQENKSKIQRYLEFYRGGLITEKLGHFPVLVWLTTSELRKNKLKDLCKELPVVKVYTMDEIK